jgi:hypothetical protein
MGVRRDQVVVHSRIRRQDPDAYHGGYSADGLVAADLPAGAAES